MSKYNYTIEKIIFFTGIKCEDSGENINFVMKDPENVNDTIMTYILSLTTHFACSIQHEVNGSMKTFNYKTVAFDKENKVMHVYLKKAPKVSVQINQ